MMYLLCIWIQPKGEWNLVGSAKSCRWVYPVEPASESYSDVESDWPTGSVPTFLVTHSPGKFGKHVAWLKKNLPWAGTISYVPRIPSGESACQRASAGSGDNKKPRRSGAVRNSSKKIGVTRPAGRLRVRNGLAVPRTAPAGRYDSPGRCRSASASTPAGFPRSRRPRRRPCGQANGRAGSSS